MSDGTSFYVRPKGPRTADSCPWCRHVPVNALTTGGLAGCSCYRHGAPDPCDSPRCPATAGGLDPFAPRILTNVPEGR